MGEPRRPDSDSVRHAAIDVASNGDPELAEANIGLLIALTRDADPCNRNWAAMTLANLSVQSAAVRVALRRAAEDRDCSVRGEAILGIVRVDPAVALALVQRELRRDKCGYAVFQAARLLANPSLLEGLQAWHDRTGACWVNDEVRAAIRACKSPIRRNSKKFDPEL